MNIIDIIDTNLYINKNHINKDKDTTSLSYLINIKLTSSQSIKLGISLEKCFEEFILYNSKYISIKSDVNIKHQLDHIFLLKNSIIYAELKSNINLDTEKIYGLYNKILNVKDGIYKKYKNFSIGIYLVSLRYLHKKDIPKNIIQKYYKYNLQNNIIGLNEYLSLFKNISYTYDEYSNILNYIIFKMYD
jgi:hypothetical protein